MELHLIISASRSLVLSFLVKERDVLEIKVDRREQQRLVGSVFKGRVKRLAKSLDGAFLDIGLEKEVYLHLKGADGEEERRTPLEVGEEVIVQMKREAMGEKGAKVTDRISLPGRYLVYLPTTTKILVSSKIEDGKRDHLRKLFGDVLKNEGVIIRTCAGLASEDELLKELELLREKWEGIRKKASSTKVGLLHRGDLLWAQIIRDYWHEISEIVVDERDLWMELVSFLEEDFPELVDRVRYVRDAGTFFRRYDLDRAINRLFSKYVWLKGGGYIIIEETQAMTVIDVNSGVGCGETLEENALKTNLEAAEEIVRQIKLRDIGGIIVIDFIDMKDRRNKEKVVKRVKDLLSDEGSKVHVYGITNLGLLELTRKKESPSTARLLSVDCPYCKGKGFIKSPEMVLYEIEKEISHFKGRYLELRVNPAIKESVERLLEEKNLKRWVRVEEECDAPPDYYEMFLAG